MRSAGGGPATSWRSTLPNPPGAASRIAAYTSRASSGPSEESTSAIPDSSGTCRGTLASGAKRRTVPRFVFVATARRVASIAARIVAPTRCLAGRLHRRYPSAPR